MGTGNLNFCRGLGKPISIALPPPSWPPRATLCPASPKVIPPAAPSPDTRHHTPSAGTFARWQVRLVQKPSLSQCRDCSLRLLESDSGHLQHRLRYGPRLAQPPPSHSEC